MRTLNSFLRCELQPTAILTKINQACFIACIIGFATVVALALGQG
mgnify:CR=1 FL=1